jgi:hypothetical protein
MQLPWSCFELTLLRCVRLYACLPVPADAAASTQRELGELTRSTIGRLQPFLVARGQVGDLFRCVLQAPAHQRPDRAVYTGLLWPSSPAGLWAVPAPAATYP